RKTDGRAVRRTYANHTISHGQVDPETKRSDALVQALAQGDHGSWSAWGCSPPIVIVRFLVDCANCLEMRSVCRRPRRRPGLTVSGNDRCSMLNGIAANRGSPSSQLTPGFNSNTDRRGISAANVCAIAS